MTKKNTDNLINRTPSTRYVLAMGDGWNLGNSFDSFDSEDDKEEESWGNPRVTKQLIQTIKRKGYSSIRLPLTVHMRIDGAENDFKIKESFLDRYEQVVQWAIEENLYVMINIHHDSVTWLKEWDGDRTAEAYIKYVRIWEQLVERFKHYDNRVMFESINEPQFNAVEESSISYLMTLNDAFYHIVRQSGGKNESRMLVLPTLLTNDSQNKLDALYDQIVAFEDDYIIATVHYYSVWIYSANLGKTRFDQPLWDTHTPRTSMREVFDRVAETFVNKGIGVVIGEYGLLGYDKSESANQFGETLKYLEYINYYAKEKSMCLMLWDNGQHLNRYDHEWSIPRFGDMIEQSMKGRSSSTLDLDTIYLDSTHSHQNIAFPLMLNGNRFQSVSAEGLSLVKEKEYTFKDETVTLSTDYVQQLVNQNGGRIGSKGTVVCHFSSGADWHQTIVYVKDPVLKKANGRVEEELFIPIDYNGHDVEKVLVTDSNQEVVANQKHWQYLQHSVEFRPDPDKGGLYLLSTLTSLLDTGEYEINLTFFSGLSKDYQLRVINGLIEGCQK